MDSEKNLKTLKDLKRYYRGDGFNYQREIDLRAEAVKWAKNKYEKTENGKVLHSFDFYEWLDFFNITEEDLK